MLRSRVLRDEEKTMKEAKDFRKVSDNNVFVGSEELEMA